jgi:hypothetical protein
VKGREEKDLTNSVSSKKESSREEVEKEEREEAKRRILKENPDMPGFVLYNSK